MDRQRGLLRPWLPQTHLVSWATFASRLAWQALWKQSRDQTLCTALEAATLPDPPCPEAASLLGAGRAPWQHPGMRVPPHG